MHLVPYTNNNSQVIAEYHTVWFRQGQELGTYMTSDADYGIEVWYNELDDGLWHAMPVAIVWFEEGVSAPMLRESITASSSEEVVQEAHVVARRLLDATL